MAINEEYRQLEIAAEVEELMRTLAHSTRDVPKPSESYPMLGELGAIIDHAAQVCDQLASWNTRAQHGRHHDGEDGGTTDSPRAVAYQLTSAASALRKASEHVLSAQGFSSAVRWYDEPQNSRR